MEFTITTLQSDSDNTFFIEEEYQSSKENNMLLTDRPEEEARKTFLTDLEGFIEGLKHNQVFVARSSEGAYAGMIWLAQRTSKEPWDFSELPGWVYDIRVRPEFRGNGLGRALLGKALGWAKAAGLAQVGLHVFGSNTAAVNLYTTSGYKTVYSYLQKDITLDKADAQGEPLLARPYRPETDLAFTRQLLFEQYQGRALASASPKPDAVEAGFEKCLKNFNFGSPNKELVIAENEKGVPAGVLWFYKSKGDLGKRRYVWLHAAQALNPSILPNLLNYLEGWAVENELDAIRTPLHQSENGLAEVLKGLNYHPANLFMYKTVTD
jgi:ribosomal protein S18 acetylase RimI-like enzyme